MNSVHPANRVTIHCQDAVSSVEFAPYEGCHELLAVGTSSRVSVYRVVFEVCLCTDSVPVYFSGICILLKLL